MKLKESPEDFQVEEITAVAGGPEGDFAFYRLEKSNWTTPEALMAIGSRWKLDPRRVSSGGLKDRHARTSQYLTILHGPRRGLRHDTIHLHYLGQVTGPYTSADVQANRFRLVLRQLPPALEGVIETRLERIARQGVPAYFDDQRFGSVSGPGGEFIARHLVHGRFEEALHLALTAPYEFDRGSQKREKQLLRDHWGQWERLETALPRGHARNLVHHLRTHRGDFKGAVIRLRPELRGLYLSVYQSHLWNRVLARWLTENVPAASLFRVQLRTGPVPFPTELTAETAAKLTTLSLPLPAARWKPAADDPRLPLVEAVLAEEGLVLGDVQVRGVRELFFSRGERAALCRVENLSHAWADDERHPGTRRLSLAFDLARGTYATIVVKVLTSSDEPH